MDDLILLVEDERAIADTVRYALERERYRFVWAPTGAQALAQFADRAPALVLLDIGLPDCSGLDLFQRLRELAPATPVIFLTARNDEIDRVLGLELGGDDYVSKPFSPRELVARVRSVLRRCERQLPLSDNAGETGFCVDPERMLISYRGRRLQLSTYEFRLLALLLGRPEKVFSREEILQRAWDEPEMTTDRTIDAHIKSIRKKLREIDPLTDPIRTVRGVGYAIASDDDRTR